MSSLIRPEIKLVQAFMPVLVTGNFDDDSIKNERASMETAFSHYKSMGSPAIVYAESIVVIGPFFVGACPCIQLYRYNPTEI